MGASRRRDGARGGLELGDFERALATQECTCVFGDAQRQRRLPAVVERVAIGAVQRQQLDEITCMLFEAHCLVHWRPAVELVAHVRIGACLQQEKNQRGSTSVDRR